MKPRRTHWSDSVFRLPGGTEDNDLWLQRDNDVSGAPVLRSTWEPTDDEREAIAAGMNVELVVWGTGHPPVSMGVTDVPLGKPHQPQPEEDNVANRVCRECGCTDDRACLSPSAGPCAWVEDDLCSACVADAPADYQHPEAL